MTTMPTNLAPDLPAIPVPAIPVMIPASCAQTAYMSMMTLSHTLKAGMSLLVKKLLIGGWNMKLTGLMSVK
jgi:hypothetical protein